MRPSRLAVKSGDFKSPITLQPVGSRGFESRLGLDFFILVIKDESSKIQSLEWKKNNITRCPKKSQNYYAIFNSRMRT